MRRTQLSEKRWNTRVGFALRVVLSNRDARMQATTRNISFGGMQLVTAMKAPSSGREFTASIETTESINDKSALAVRVVWSNNRSAGVEFNNLTFETVNVLRGILKEARARDVCSRDTQGKTRLRVPFDTTIRDDYDGTQKAQ